MDGQGLYVLLLCNTDDMDGPGLYLLLLCNTVTALNCAGIDRQALPDGKLFAPDN